MRVKVITGLGDSSVVDAIRKDSIEVIDDIPYQDGVLEIIKRNFVDVVVISEELEGEFDKYIFIDKIREIDSKIKIIMIVFNEDENYKKFLYSRGVFDIFIDGKATIEELINCIDIETTHKVQKDDFKAKNTLRLKECKEEIKSALKSQIVPKFQKQEIIVFTGSNGVGKTTFAVQTSIILAKYTSAKVLLIDFDTENAGISYRFGCENGPKDIEYILPSEKNSSLNYMIEAIDKKKLDANTFEKYLIKSKQFSNLDILTGNKSLYVSKNVLNFEYYIKILETAKSLYDFIVIDSSSNVFLDSMQFSLINAGKIFFVTEGNYVALERAHRMIFDIFPGWGINDKKINVLINKYGRKSLNKTIVDNMLKESPVFGYISFSDKYEESINSINPILSREIENEFYTILEKSDLVPKRPKIKKITDKIYNFSSRLKNGGKK